MGSLDIFNLNLKRKTLQRHEYACQRLVGAYWLEQKRRKAKTDSSE